MQGKLFSKKAIRLFSVAIFKKQSESKIMYNWRKLNEEQRNELMLNRKTHRYPMHSPPHFSFSERLCYHLSSANFEHEPIIGAHLERISTFSDGLCSILNDDGNRLHAWCVLPNHWHALLETLNLKKLLRAIGILHGRSSFMWNKEDNTRGVNVGIAVQTGKFDQRGIFM